MSKLSFVKAEGAGNDFILIDNRALFFDPKQVPKLCHRRYGIGADGVILLQNDPFADFRMRIFNSNGSEAESCGNGIRCFMKFLLHLGMEKRPYRIANICRTLDADFVGDLVSVDMGEALDERGINYPDFQLHFLNTGVPHAVIFTSNLEQVDVITQGSLLRYDPMFGPQGTNVNFAEIQPDGSIKVRTYERGLEGESVACGTGAAAVAYVAFKKNSLPNPVRIRFSGGEILVRLDAERLHTLGPANILFSGNYY